MSDYDIEIALLKAMIGGTVKDVVTHSERIWLDSWSPWADPLYVDFFAVFDPESGGKFGRIQICHWPDGLWGFRKWRGEDIRRNCGACGNPLR